MTEGEQLGTFSAARSGCGAVEELLDGQLAVFALEVEDDFVGCAGRLDDEE